MKTSEVRARAALLALGVTFAAAAVGVGADVAATPAWRVNGGISTALLRGGLVYVGGAFTQLHTPSTSEDQFYDLVTGQVRAHCARSTTTRPLGGTPDGRGGLLVSVRPDDAFADVNGEFVPPPGTTIARIGDDCLWDRVFAAPSIDPATPGDLTIGLPVRVGGVVLASNSVVGPDGFLRAQVAAFDAVTGSRLAFQFYQGTSEIGMLGASADRAIVRVRDAAAGAYTLGAVTPATLTLVPSTTVLLDESTGARVWIRDQTMYRARPAPASTVEAYDVATLQAKAGWTPPVAPALADLDVVGTRVFLAASVVNGQPVSQPAAVLAATGVIDSTWTPAALTRRAPDPSGTPYVPTLSQLATDGVRLYFSGDFERVGGNDREGVAAIAVASGSLDPWDPTPLLVSPLEYSPGGLLMTRPSGANRASRRYLAAIDRATGVATAWNPNDPARVLLHQATPVAALAADAAHVYFASATTGEVRRADVATADVDQTWRVVVSRSDGTPGSITTMAVDSGRVFLGGEFDSLYGTNISPTPRRALASVGADGTLSAWAPALDGPAGATLIRSILAHGQTIYLGGDFTSVATQIRLGFAAVDPVSGALTQPEMFVLGDTRINGLATDGAQVFVGGVTFGAPLVGATSIPDTALTQFGPTGGVVPTSVAFVAGRLYAGLEYDTTTGAPTARQTQWGTVFADDQGLVHLPDNGGSAEYYPALPGLVPEPPVLSALATGNTVVVSWSRAPTGGAPTSYTLFAGTAPGATNLGSAVFRGVTTFTATVPTGLYYLTVIARNGFGASRPSNEVAVQAGCVMPPPAPGTLTFTTAGPSVTLGWGPAPTAAAYVLEAGQSPGAANLGAFVLPNATSLVASPPLGLYYVRIRGANACGLGPATNEVAVTLDGSVTAPNPPTALTAVVSGRVVAFTWTPPKSGGTPAGYRVEGSTVPGGVSAVVSTGASSLVVPGAPSGTYYVRVRGFNAAGFGAATADLTVTVP